MARNPLLAEYSTEQSPLTQGSPTLADAWSHNTATVGDWLQQQRAISAERGLLNPETGLPTKAGIVDAARQFSMNALMSTTTPAARLPSWCHGTASKFDAFNTPEVYMTNSEAQAIKYAEAVHKPGSGNQNDPRVLLLDLKHGAAQNINDDLFNAMDEGLDLDFAISEAAARARQEGKVRYLEYNHPNAGDQGEHLVRISLYPEADVRSLGDWLNLERPR